MQIAAICMQLTSPHAPFKTYRYIYFKRKSLCRDANACAWSPHWAMYTMIARWFNLKTPVFKVQSFWVALVLFCGVVDLGML